MASGTWTTPPTQTPGGNIEAADHNIYRDDLNAAFGNVAELRISKAANQVITNNTVTTISFDTETTDTDGFITVPSGTVTIPAGFGGRYMCSITAKTTADPGTRTFILVNVGPGRLFNSNGSAQELDQFATFTMRLAAGDTIQAAVYHNAGFSIGFTSTLELQRTAI